MAASVSSPWRRPVHPRSECHACQDAVWSQVFWDTSGTHVAMTVNKTPDLRGFLKRMKGLEPSTFCMASVT